MLTLALELIAAVFSWEEAEADGGESASESLEGS